MAAPLLGLQQIVQFWIELCTPKSPAAGFEAEAVALPLVLPLVSLLCLCLPRKTDMFCEPEIHALRAWTLPGPSFSSRVA